MARLGAVDLRSILSLKPVANVPDNVTVTAGARASRIRGQMERTWLVSQSATAAPKRETIHQPRSSGAHQRTLSNALPAWRKQQQRHDAGRVTDRQSKINRSPCVRTVSVNDDLSNVGGASNKTKHNLITKNSTQLNRRRESTDQCHHFDFSRPPQEQTHQRRSFVGARRVGYLKREKKKVAKPTEPSNLSCFLLALGCDANASEKTKKAKHIAESPTASPFRLKLMSAYPPKEVFCIRASGTPKKNLSRAQK